MKSFYFNKNKKYKFSEMWINWWLSILIIALLIWIVFLGLIIKDSHNADSKLTFINDKLNWEINVKEIGNFILIIFIFLPIFFGLIMTGHSKLIEITKRNFFELRNEIKDLFEQKDIKKLSDDDIKKIFIDLKLWNMFSKKKSINSFTREKMELRIKRELRTFFYAQEFAEFKRKHIKIKAKSQGNTK